VYKAPPLVYNERMSVREAIPIKPEPKPGDAILAMIRTKYPDYHPVMALADLAHHTDDERIELDCHKTIATFIAPTLKSVEVRAEIEHRKRVTVEIFDAVSLDDKPEASVLSLEQPIEDAIPRYIAEQVIMGKEVIGE